MGLLLAIDSIHAGLETSQRTGNLDLTFYFVVCKGFVLFLLSFPCLRTIETALAAINQSLGRIVLDVFHVAAQQGDSFTERANSNPSQEQHLHGMMRWKTSNTLTEDVRITVAVFDLTQENNLHYKI